MKKIVYTALIMLFYATAYAQNSIKNKMVIPQKKSFFPFTKIEQPTPPLSFANFTYGSSGENSLKTILSNLPVLRLKETSGKKPALFITEFSFNDILENSINSVDGSLLNTYDDHISELFKDAPSIVKVKCIINL